MAWVTGFSTWASGKNNTEVLHINFGMSFGILYIII